MTPAGARSLAPAIWIPAARAWCAALVLLGTVTVLGPSSAEADWRDVMNKCSANGKRGLGGGIYTTDELKEALRRMPADLEEYSECRELIAGVLRDIRRAYRDLAAQRDEDGSANVRRAGAGGGGDGRGDARPEGPTFGAAGEVDDSVGATAGAAGDPGVRRPSDTHARGDSAADVTGALLTGAAGGSAAIAPFDAVDSAAAAGGLEPPGWVLSLLAVVALLGVGAGRERRA